MLHWLHLKPWEIDRLTIDQFQRYVAWIEAELKAREKGANGG